jgi:hypothetical protein
MDTQKWAAAAAIGGFAIVLFGHWREQKVLKNLIKKFSRYAFSDLA